MTWENYFLNLYSEKQIQIAFNPLGYLS